MDFLMDYFAPDPKITIFHRNFTIPIKLCSSHTSLLHKFKKYFLKVYIHQLRGQERFLIYFSLKLCCDSDRSNFAISRVNIY